MESTGLWKHSSGKAHKGRLFFYNGNRVGIFLVPWRKLKNKQQFAVPICDVIVSLTGSPSQMEIGWIKINLRQISASLNLFGQELCIVQLRDKTHKNQVLTQAGVQLQNTTEWLQFISVKENI